MAADAGLLVGTIKNIKKLEHIKSKLKKLLQVNLDELTQELNLTLKENSSFYDDFIIINGRLKQLERDETRNVISKDERDKSLNNIRVGLLRIINSTQFSDFKNNSELQPNRSNLNLSEENHRFKNLENEYLQLKTWLEQNFKEFDHWFTQKEIEIEKEGEDITFEDSIQKSSSLKIFGSNFVVNFILEEKDKWRYFVKEDNFQTKTITVNNYVFNALEIFSIKLHEESKEGNFATNLHELKIECFDGLNKIRINRYFEFDRLQHDENIDEWEKLEEGSVEDGYTNLLILKTTNIKFIKAFILKFIEFQELCKKIE